MATKAASIPFTGPEDLFDARATLSTRPEGWRAIVHVPLIPQKGATLHRFLFRGAAFPLAEGGVAMIVTGRPGSKVRAG